MPYETLKSDFWITQSITTAYSACGMLYDYDQQQCIQKEKNNGMVDIFLKIQ